MYWMVMDLPGLQCRSFSRRTNGFVDFTLDDFDIVPIVLSICSSSSMAHHSELCPVQNAFTPIMYGPLRVEGILSRGGVRKMFAVSRALCAIIIFTTLLECLLAQLIWCAMKI